MRGITSVILSIVNLYGPVVGFELLYKDKSNSVTEFSFDSFQKEVLVDDSSIDWVIIFYADWCGHCRVFAPKFIELADSFQQSDMVRFGAIDCAADMMTKIESEDVCRLFDIKSYPSIRLFRHGRNDRPLPNNIEDLRVSVSSLGTGTSQSVSVHRLPSSVEVSDSLRFSNSDHADVIHDASMALYEIFRREVFRGATTILSGPAFSDLLRLLTVCQSIGVAEFMHGGCQRLFADIKDSSMLSRARWSILLSQHFASNDISSAYRACVDFSCAMWRFLHVMSFSPETSSMDDIRFLIDKYFSCEECRTNFLRHFDDCDFGRCTAIDGPKSVALWLWRLHNAVNTRLGHREWPSPSYFSEEEVYVLLKSTYTSSEAESDPEPFEVVAQFFPTSVYVMAGGGFVVLGLIAGLARNGDRLQTTFSRISSQVNKKYYEPIV